MDILTVLSPETTYSTRRLQAILSAWVLSTALERKKKISTANGDVAEDDYTKQSIYALLYSLYRSMGEVRSDTGERYEMTFNTWGYTWPADWGPAPSSPTDPQRFGKNAYAGLYAAPAVKKFLAEHQGKVHIVEMGCGTGAGAHLTCMQTLPEATYQAVDMQEAAIQTCKRKFVPDCKGRLVATRSDATQLTTRSGSADIVAVCETHVTEMAGIVTDEDKRFFQTAHRIVKSGGLLVWGNAIPDSTWKPCFDYLESIGFKKIEERDVTKEAIKARDEDQGRMDAYVEQCLTKFVGFRIPVYGPRKRVEAEQALKNFARNPGTNLYDTMVTRTDSYRVVAFQKA